MPLRETTGVGQAQDTAEAVARQSYGKLLAFLAARTGDVASAEDALSDAFAAALTHWPVDGTPKCPEAWLTTVARRKLIDHNRRRSKGDAVAAQLQIVAETVALSSDDDQIPDDRLLLMFACAHPAIDAGVRAPLILQTILGFDAQTIASAFLISPSTMSQRLVRAKAKIKDAGIPFRLPERTELAERLDCVLQAVYAAYAEGWSDPAGTDTRRRNLAEDALWLGSLIAHLLPQEPEALGLLALMLHSEARRETRRDAAGDFVPLSQQNAERWNARCIAEAEVLLFRASTLGAIGRYQLEAAIQSVHASRRLTGRTDWEAIEQFYGALAAISDSPVVTVNRAIALGETQGPGSGLALLDQVAEPLAHYQPYWAARADLLARSGATEAADHAYQRAIGLEQDPAVRRFLQQRRESVGAGVRKAGRDARPTT